LLKRGGKNAFEKSQNTPLDKGGEKVNSHPGRMLVRSL